MQTVKINEVAVIVPLTRKRGFRVNTAMSDMRATYGLLRIGYFGMPFVSHVISERKA